MELRNVPQRQSKLSSAEVKNLDLYFKLDARAGGERTNKIASTTVISLLLFSVAMLNIPYCQSLPTDPYVYVLVWTWPYTELEPALTTYKHDLENAGFSVEIRHYPYPPLTWGANATNIRKFLQTEAKTHEIAGALLVGDVPYANYTIEDEKFPCDLYYMDLDGNWTDSDYDGAYDMHTNETGDLEPEIWVGRLYASTLTFGDKNDLLNNYFNKNHHFRTGNLTLPRRALAYIDDKDLEFVYIAEAANNSLSMIYGNEITLVTDPNTTSATDYKNRLNDTLGYEWLHLVAHGNHKKHCFWAFQNQTDVFSSDILNIDPHVFFCNILACNTADYAQTNYIGGSYIFADTYGLLVLGSTKLHNIWDASGFYEYISKGKCIGQAFKEWFEKYGELNRYSCYGLTILGDPTLRAPRIYNQTRDVAVTSVKVGDSCYGATEVYPIWDVVINVTLRNEGVFVEAVNITVYYDNNTIEKQALNLFPAADRNLILLWNLTCVPHGNYTISAYVTPVPDENETTDNTHTDGWIKVRVLGDVNGDGNMTSTDITILNSLLTKIMLEVMTMEEALAQYPFADLNGDGKFTGTDITVNNSVLTKIMLGP